MAGLLKRAILLAATNRVVTAFVQRHAMRFGASRFVAGETLDQCVGVLRRLNERGLRANTTLLGEDVTDEIGAAGAVSAYEEILDRIAHEALRVNVALKLTHLGLGLGEELAYDNASRVVDRAADHSNFVRIDMERSSVVDATLRIYRRLRESRRDNVGCVLQAYLRRSERDLIELLPLRPNLRLVKGAYLEPPELAFAHKREVDAAYIRLLEAALRGGAYVAVATHDERLIEHAIQFAERERISPDRFEFQMLYGVRPQLQRDLVARRYAVLVATPFGPAWYPYLMRRLAERPANLLFLLRSLLRR
ncbi:MAG: proline dehydrogenase family protein [Gaiellaceae bacterium]